MKHGQALVRRFKFSPDQDTGELSLSIEKEFSKSWMVNMRRSIHRYVIPPVYIILHGVLLLPLLLGYKTDPTQSNIPLRDRIHYELSIPLGASLFVLTTLLRYFAGHFLFPRLQANQQTLANIEWIVLYVIGSSEEIFRWIAVRILVRVEGGEGGFGGEGIEKPTRAIHDLFQLSSVEVKPGLWEGVYVMCWIWSLLECPVSS